MRQELIDPTAHVIVDGPWGQVQLAYPRWDVDRWSALSATQQQHVYQCHAYLPYFFHHVILPYESEAESKVWPQTLPKFMGDALFTAQAMTPYADALVHAGLLPHRLPEYRLCYLEPMGHFKTTMFVVGLPLWLIARNPSVTLLIACPKVEFAADRVARILQQIEANERFVQMFGYLKPERPLPGDSWTSEKATVARPLRRSNPTLRAFGATSDVVGVRADAAIVDDAVTKLNITTSKSRGEVHDFIDNTVHARLDADNRMMFVIGTSYHYDDAYQQIERDALTTGTWRFVRKPAILNAQDVPWPPPPPDGHDEYRAGDEQRMDFSRTQVLWPEFWTAQKLFVDWLKSPSAFSAERQNQPVDPLTKLFPLKLLRDRCRADGGADPDGVLRPRLRRWALGIGRPMAPVHWLWREYVDQGFDLAHAKVLLSVDATAGGSGSRKERRDYNVLELWLLFDDGRRVLVALWRKQGDPVRLLKPTLGAWLRAFVPDKVLFESNVFQHLVATDWEQQFGVPFDKVPMPPNKEEHFQGMSDVIDARLLFYAGAESGCRSMVAPFEDEMDQYPSSAHDDCLTAALHVHMFAKPNVLISRRPARVRALDLMGMRSNEDRVFEHLLEESSSAQARWLEKQVEELRQALQQFSTV